MIDFNKIVDEILGENPQIDDEYSFAMDCMVEAIKQAIPLILTEVSEKAKIITTNINDKSTISADIYERKEKAWALHSQTTVDKQSILSLQEYLEEKLLK